MSRQVGLFRGLLRIYPASFRAGYADEMTRLFAEQLDDATASDRPLAVLHLWARCMADLAVTAPGHHIRREQPVPRPVDGGSANAFVAPSGPSSGTRIVLGLLPLWLFLLLVVAAPGFMDPIFSNPPAVLGVPAGVVMALVVFAWTTLGVVVLQRTSTFLGALISFLVFTGPAAMGVVFIPASILILMNLAV